MKPIDGTQEEIWNLETLQRMDWRGFELLCAEIFRALDYEVEETCTGPDGGIDLICETADFDFVVQCKREKKPVEATAVREFCGCMLRDYVGKGAFITTGTFNGLATEEFCDHPDVELIDGLMVLEGIAEFPTSDQESWRRRLATGPDWDIPTCPNCDLKMCLRVGKKSRNEFWGCPNYGRKNCQEKLWPDAFPIYDHHRH